MQINPEVVRDLTIYIVNSSNPKINLGVIKTSSICEPNVQKKSENSKPNLSNE